MKKKYIFFLLLVMAMHQHISAQGLLYGLKVKSVNAGVTTYTAYALGVNVGSNSVSTSQLTIVTNSTALVNITNTYAPFNAYNITKSVLNNGLNYQAAGSTGTNGGLISFVGEADLFDFVIAGVCAQVTPPRLYINGVDPAAGVLGANFAQSIIAGLNFYIGNDPLGSEVDCPLSILPVSLLYFKVTVQGRLADIKWLSANESGVHHYEVERSLNGALFSKIASDVAAKESANGNYLVTDKQLATLEGTLYYRLKVVGKNGSYIYSDLISVNVNNKINSIFIAPNVITKGQDILAKVTGDIAYIKVSNSYGQIIKNIPVAGRQNIPIATNMLARGIYIVQAIQENGQYTSQRFIVY